MDLYLDQQGEEHAPGMADMQNKEVKHSILILPIEFQTHETKLLNY